MRILVTGDRCWQCFDLAERIVNRLIARYGYGLTIVHGAATGVDESFAKACAELGIKTEPHIAEWRHWGTAAWPMRNARMVAAGAAMCIALHRTLETGKGTKDCVRKAIAAGIPTFLITDD